MKKWGNHLKELHNRLKEESYQHIRFRNRVRMVIIIFDVKGKRIDPMTPTSFFYRPVYSFGRTIWPLASYSLVNLSMKFNCFSNR